MALLVQRDPIQFAKEIATLDVVSGGRVDVGVGGGWNLEEMRNHGTDPSTRWRLLRERVEAVRAIWTMDVAEHHGELVTVEPMVSRPKPVQRRSDRSVPPDHAAGWRARNELGIPARRGGLRHDGTVPHRAGNAGSLPTNPTRADVIKAYGSIRNETLDGLLPQPITFTPGKPQPLVNCFWLARYENGTFSGDATPMCDPPEVLKK